MNVPAADHAERQRRIEERRAGHDGDGFLARVDEIGIDRVIDWIGAGSQDAVLGVQGHLHVVAAEMLGSSVGRPIPRLTYSPSIISVRGAGCHLVA